MEIRSYTCPHCQGNFKIYSNLEGTEIKCPLCCGKFVLRPPMPEPKENEKVYRCPHCKGHLCFDESYEGKRVNCSLCGGSFIVNDFYTETTKVIKKEEPQTSVYSCPGCLQHLEIDKVFKNTKVQCPACNTKFFVLDSLLVKREEEIREIAKAKEDLGSCGLGLACFSLLFNVIFGIIAIVISSQANAYARTGDCNKARELSSTSIAVSWFGIIIGIFVWIGIFSNM